MATLTYAKSVLRTVIKKRLAALTAEEKKKQSEIVVNKVLEAPWFKESHRVSLFLSMPDEIDTLPLLKASLAAGKECFIPYYKGPLMRMIKLSCLEDYEKLPVTKWNIRQPADENAVPDAIETGGLDIIFMPGLAFTQQGTRLGRGCGYYDGYLRKCCNAGVHPRTVALIFHQQLEEYVPVGEADEAVHQVLYADPEEPCCL